MKVIKKIRRNYEERERVECERETDREKERAKIRGKIRGSTLV